MHILLATFEIRGHRWALVDAGSKGHTWTRPSLGTRSREGPIFPHLRYYLRVLVHFAATASSLLPDTFLAPWHMPFLICPACPSWLFYSWSSTGFYLLWFPYPNLISHSPPPQGMGSVSKRTFSLPPADRWTASGRLDSPSSSWIPGRLGSHSPSCSQLCHGSKSADVRQNHSYSC